MGNVTGPSCDVQTSLKKSCIDYSVSDKICIATSDKLNRIVFCDTYVIQRKMDIITQVCVQSVNQNSMYPLTLLCFQNFFLFTESL